MATIRAKFTAPYQTRPVLIVTPAQLLARHFWGLPTCASNGQEISNAVIEQKIIDAQMEVENYFFIKLFPQLIRENINYDPQQFSQYGFTKVSYAVLQVFELQGWYGQSLQTEYPRAWLSTRVETSTFNSYGSAQGSRHFYVIPNGGGAVTTSGVTYNGPFAAYTFRSAGSVPNYWYVTYLTGFERLPSDLINVVEKLAAIQVFAQLGDTYLAPGISSQSISLDGLSQTMSTIRNSDGGVYAPRIKQYVKELTDKIDDLRGKYRGIIFDML